MGYQEHYQLFKRFFGININFHRKEQKLSISELATTSGFSVQFLELIEQGNADMDFDDFFRIARSLKIQPFMLLENIWADDESDELKPLSVFDINPELML